MNGKTKPPNDVQGYLLGLPYDFRRLKRARFARLWQSGGPWIVPKVWGVGYALNLAHPATWLFFAVVATLAFWALQLG